jgi:hypothetical protein
MSALPHLKVDDKAEVAFDDRSVSDAMLDMAAASLRGALLACESEFDGEMSVSWEILIRTANEFLDDVKEAAGADVARAYAQRMIEAMEAR